VGIEPVPGQGQTSSVGIEPVPGTGTGFQRGYMTCPWDMGQVVSRQCMRGGQHDSQGLVTIGFLEEQPF